VSGKHVEVTPALEDHLAKKVIKIKKFFDGILDVHAILSVEKRQHRAEINIQADGVYLHGDSTSDDMYRSIDVAVSRIQTQLLKYKKKLQNHRLRKTEAPVQARPPIGVMVNVISGEDVHYPEGEPQIIRSRQYTIKPMSLDEAAMQMDLSHQNVLVFLDERTDRVNVLYRRNDGDYELIVPEA
jgi:putative sigma-54 modulation protein